MYLMQTVSAVPRPRTAAHTEAKSSYANPTPGEYPKHKSHSLENGMLNHARIIYELGASNENETESSVKRQKNEINRRSADDVPFEEIQAENEEEKEKKKEKKWTLGGFFRRKCKRDGDDSSEDSGEDGRKGFLSRRKSKRERRKSKARSTANGFDVVIPQQNSKPAEISAEQLWSGDGIRHLKTGDSAACNGPVRYIHRHGPGPEVKTNKDSLQVPKHCRRDSNLSRSSGGSDNAEGRKVRKEAMARAQAKRDLMRDDSSSDENESHHSNSSLNRLGGDSSRRPRRTDKHKRLSRDEENQSLQNENESGIVRSDFDRLPAIPSRWTSKTYYPDSSDHEAVKFNLMNHSGTPSPCRSPRARQKQLLLYASLVHKAYPTSTFPPGAHHQQPRNAMAGSAFASNRSRVHATENQLRGSQSFFGCRSLAQTGSRSAEHDLTRSPSAESAGNPTTEHERFLSSCGAGKENGSFRDRSLHRACRFENEPGSPRLPIKTNHQNALENCKRQDGSEALTSDGRRDDIYNHNIPLRAVRRSESGTVVENRTDSTPSLPNFQPGIFPHRPTQIVQRSASGNSFCDSFESSRSFYPGRSNSYQHIPASVNQARQHPRKSQNGRQNVAHFWSQDEAPRPGSPERALGNAGGSGPPPPNSAADSVCRPSGSPSVLRYYADQNPRSRNPIHITCNPTTNGFAEQPYLSDSQVATKPFLAARSSASDFWRPKHRETCRNPPGAENSLKPPATQSTSRSDRSRSSSPRSKDATRSPAGHFEPRDRSLERNPIEAENRLVDSIDGKVYKEECDADKVNKTPPEPPVRRLSKQEVLARLHKCEQMKSQEDPCKKNETKISNSNLDEALNELEIIYNSLRLKDEDLTDGAERRDLPALRPKNPISSVSVRDKIQNFYAETDFSRSPGSRNSFASKGRERAVPLRRSGVPDKTTDDMAFRRMNPKDRGDVKKFPPHSYLRSGPVRSPPPGGSPTFRRDSPVLEPDVTYDDVVFRNIRHANSTLKIQDPQPPFGIPIGVVAAAPNSDYLHATPRERFRPTFASSKTPDVVKDDLAFRNLRKDNKANACLVDPGKSDSSCLTKKRAVRSLSANLYNIMRKDDRAFSAVETNGKSVFEKNCDKTQSLTDLTNDKPEKAVLERRLKELKEEKNAKRAEFFELSRESRKKAAEKGAGADLSWTDLADLNADLERLSETSLRNKWHANFSSDDSLRTPPEKKPFRSPVVELSKYPAAAPSSTLHGNPFRDPSLASPVDEDQLDTLLSALAAEAENASRDLERQLDRLETRSVSKMIAEGEAARRESSKAAAVEEFNKKFRADSSERDKRRRNLSLSSARETKEESRKTGSLERRKSRIGEKHSLPLDGSTRNGVEGRETKQEEGRGAGGALPEGPAAGRRNPLPNAERTASASDSGPARERKRSQTFRPVAELPRILRGGGAEQQPAHGEPTEKETSKVENCDVFQEVYEYNCKLADRNGRGGEEPTPFQGEESEAEGAPAPARKDADGAASDIEKEFEKLHQEVDSSTKETKETDRFSLVDDLIADITSVGQSPTEAYSSFPFPNEGGGGSSSGAEGTFGNWDGTSPGPSKGEEMDFLTALGIALAVISIVAILIL